MKQEPKIYSPGDAIELTWIKSNVGNMPIAKADNGIVCLIDNHGTTKKHWYEIGSTWLCEVTEVCEKKMYVVPHSELVSTPASAFEASRMAQKIATVHPEKHRTTARSYPYMNIVERRKNYNV